MASMYDQRDPGGGGQSINPSSGVGGTGRPISITIGGDTSGGQPKKKVKKRVRPLWNPPGNAYGARRNRQPQPQGGPTASSAASGSFGGGPVTSAGGNVLTDPRTGQPLEYATGQMGQYSGDDGINAGGMVSMPSPGYQMTPEMYGGANPADGMHAPPVPMDPNAWARLSPVVQARLRYAMANRGRHGLAMEGRGIPGYTPETGFNRVAPPAPPVMQNAAMPQAAPIRQPMQRDPMVDNYYRSITGGF